MTGQEKLDMQLQYMSACAKKQYEVIKRNLEYKPLKNASLDELRLAILNRAKYMKEYFTPEKLSYDEYGDICDVNASFFDSVAFLVNHAYISNAEELATICLIMHLFKKIGVDINAIMATEIWSDVSDEYCAQWLGCTNEDAIWVDIICHFLFNKWGDDDNLKQ